MFGEFVVFVVLNGVVVECRVDVWMVVVVMCGLMVMMVVNVGMGGEIIKGLSFGLKKSSWLR